MEGHTEPNIVNYLHAMKHLLFLIPLALLHVQSIAQPFIDFPTDGAIWVNTEYTYTFNPPNPIPASDLTDVDYYCTLGMDTTIQSNLYTQVYRCGDTYKGALRQDNGVVYFVPRDSVDEYLLYDFGAQENQTLQNVFIGNHFDDSFMLQDFTVNQTGTEFIGGMTRRVVYADQYRWIEGIGCVTGLFMEPWANVSLYENRLECMSVNGTTLFPTDGSGDCSLTVAVATAKNISAQIYPNPNAGIATLQFGTVQTDVLVSIFNSIGQMVASFTTADTDRVELAFEGPSGIYNVEIRVGNELRTNLKLIKI